MAVLIKVTTKGRAIAYLDYAMQIKRKKVVIEERSSNSFDVKIFTVRVKTIILLFTERNLRSFSHVERKQFPFLHLSNGIQSLREVDSESHNQLMSI